MLEQLPSTAPVLTQPWNKSKHDQLALDTDLERLQFAPGYGLLTRI